MILISRAAVATSIQDHGRPGHKISGYSRSGAMDDVSLDLANAAAGASPGAAAIEFGPSPMRVEVTARGTIAFGGAARQGAPWWQTLAVGPGDSFELGAPRDGVWSYLAIGGGAAGPVFMGSRATSVREGVGRWVATGDVIERGQDSTHPIEVTPVSFGGPVRAFGDIDERWIVTSRADRMGYVLEARTERSPLAYNASAWSEPLTRGCIQVTPSGAAIVLMSEAPTLGGYAVPAVVHGDDVRVIAQTPTGGEVHFSVVTA